MRSTLTLATLGLAALSSAFKSPPDESSKSSKKGDKANHSFPTIRFFTLTAHGPHGAHGPVGQLANGQNRIGGGANMGQYFMMDGRVMDTHHRGCLLTPLINQWQCDEGGNPTGAFGFDMRGRFTFNSNSGWFACPVNDYGEFNIYTKPVADQKKCVSIVLVAEQMPVPDSCPFDHMRPHLHGKPSFKKPGKDSEKEKDDGEESEDKPEKPAKSMSSKDISKTFKDESSKPEPSKEAESEPSEEEEEPEAKEKGKEPEEQDEKEEEEEKPKKEEKKEKGKSKEEDVQKKMKGKKEQVKATSQAFTHGHNHAKRCPLDIKDTYLKPELIVSVDQTKPNTALGGNSAGKIAPDVCTIFNFDIPKEHSNKQCSLNLHLPKSRLNGKDNAIDGKGNIYTFWLEEPIKKDVTWNTKPKGNPLGKGPVAIKAGQMAAIQQGPCPAGRKLAVQLCGDDNLGLSFTQDEKSDPIGLFMRVC